MAGRRKGRGRLSSIDQLPSEAAPFVVAAIKALNDNNRTQEAIRDELNNHLLGIEGCKPISGSAFNRYSLNLAVQGERMLRAREVASIFAERMDENPDGDIGLLIGETLKTLIYDVIIDSTLEGESPSIKMLGSAAKAVKELELARGANLRAAKLKQDNFIDDTADKVAGIAEEQGLSGERIAQMRREILGVKKAG